MQILMYIHPAGQKMMGRVLGGGFWTHGNIPRHPWAVDVVGGGHPRRAGAQSIRFERRTGYCGGADCGWNSERTELGTDGVDRPGDSTWYAWSVYHQNYQFLNNVAPIHGQFKTRNDGHHLLHRLPMDVEECFHVSKTPPQVPDPSSSDQRGECTLKSASHQFPA
jgi:hypothetical protein